MLAGERQMPARPLSGLTIVEANDPSAPYAVALATLFAGRIAADLGARVIHIANGSEDICRHAPPDVGGMGALYAFLFAGKLLVQDRGAQDRLSALADGVILDNAADPDGHAWPETAAKVIVTMNNSNPHDGRSATPESEFTATASGGLLDIVGDPDRAPLRLPGNQLAFATGLSAYTSLVALLCLEPAHRRPARVSLLDTSIWLNWKTMVRYYATGSLPRRQGRMAEWQVLRCADGWVALVYRDSDWPKLQALVEDPRLFEEQFRTREDRLANGAELAAIIEEKFVRLTRQELQAIASEEGLPLGPVWDAAEVLADRQNVERGFFTTVKRTDGTSLSMPRLPMLWNGVGFCPGEVPEGVRAGIRTRRLRQMYSAGRLPGP